MGYDLILATFATKVWHNISYFSSKMKRFFWAFETKQQTNVWLDLEKAERKIRTIHAAFVGLFPMVSRKATMTAII